MKKLFILLATAFVVMSCGPKPNEIWYTSTDGNIINPYSKEIDNNGCFVMTPADDFDANIVSNTYENGKGIIKFDRNITIIRNEAFLNCASLTSITFPNSVTVIGNSAFTGCTSLTSFYGGIASSDNRCLITDGYLMSFAPAGLTNYVIPDSVTSIGDSAFRDCTSLTSVKIPNSVTEIGDSAFEGCTSLTSVIIPNSVTTIRRYAFSGCTSLTAFYGKLASSDNRCLIVDGTLKSFAPAGLTEYTIPNYVNAIDAGVFFNCTLLTCITIPDSVTWIGTSFRDCTSLKSITIPNSVTFLGVNAFNGCTSLTSAILSSGLEEIRSNIFNGCTSLTSITIPDSVTEIENKAFYNCTSLTSVTIGNSVTSIGSSAFKYCTSLKEVYCKPTTPPTATTDSYSHWNAFDNNASERNIYVPRNSVSAYKAKQYWSDYASDIVGYDF